MTDHRAGPRPRGICPVCGELRHLRTGGVLGQHRVTIARWYRGGYCAGVDEPAAIHGPQPNPGEPPMPITIDDATHDAGLFLDLLAGAEPVGYRVTPIDPGPPLDQLLNPDAVPAALLDQLARAWPNRTRVNLVQALYGAQVLGSPVEFPAIVEQGLAEQVSRELRAGGRTLLTTTGPVWTRYPATAGIDVELATNPPLDRRPPELPWKPGDPVTGHDVLICRLAGTAVPTLAEGVPA